MAQIYLWNPLVPPAPIYTKPRDRTRGHTRSQSVASSAPKESSFASRRSTSSTSSESSASALAHLTRSTGDDAHSSSSRTRGRGSSDIRGQLHPSSSTASSEKQKLRKKQTRRRNPFRHARSNSADSAIVVAPTPLAPDHAADPPTSTFLTRTASTQGRLSSRLFHRLHAADQTAAARRSPRGAAAANTTSAATTQTHYCAHPHGPCPHLAQSHSTSTSSNPREVAPQAALQPPASETGPADSSSPSPSPSPSSSADPSVSVPRASRIPAVHCCPSCCPSLQAHDVVHPDLQVASAASTSAPFTLAASAPTAVSTASHHPRTHYDYHLAGTSTSGAAASTTTTAATTATLRAPPHTNRQHHLDPGFRHPLLPPGPAAAPISHAHPPHHSSSTATTRRSKPGRPAAAAPAITISDYPTPTLGLPAYEPKNAPLYLDTDAERVARMNAIYTTRSASLSSGTTAASSSTPGHRHNHHNPNHPHNHNHDHDHSHSRSSHSHSDSHNLLQQIMAPSEPPDTIATKPFAALNGRAYLNDPTIPYPLPVDLAELHRQSLRTLLLIQVLGAPACSAAYAARPPTRVLEIGCGSGFWSMMCHRYFRELGHGDISFTGLDIAPLAPGALPGGHDDAKPDADMDWRFVRHDLRQTPLPFPDADFDLVMVKDMSLATTHASQQGLIDEYIRVLRRGGHLEIWDSDHTIRMLRPHAPDLVSPHHHPHHHPSSAASITSTSTASSTFSSASTAAAGGGLAGPLDQDDDGRPAAALGAYVMTSNTPLSPPLNNYLVEYNGWLARALELRDLSPVPCTLVGPMLHQESECLADVRSRRLAIPLSDVKWEKEGVGGVVTKDGKSYIDTRGKKGLASGDDGAGGAGGAVKGKLGPGQAALRRTALEVVVQGIQGLEPMLREASGKRADEWDAWIGKMAADLLAEGGTAWGECLEVGAWWAQRR